MKIQTHLLDNSLQNLEDQTLSNELFRDTVVKDVAHVLSLSKSLQKHVQNTPLVRYYTIERRADNTLYCKETGQKLPSTPQGKLDRKKLESEIARKRIIGF